MPIPAHLLLTKLRFPPARAELVPRRRLVTLVNQGLTSPVTLLSAPAGYGKTTLLSSWRSATAGAALSAAWLSLDALDNEPARFLTYLAAAWGSLQPGLGETTLAAGQAA